MKRLLLIGTHLMAGGCLALTGCGDKAHQTATLHPASFSPAPAAATQPAGVPSQALSADSTVPSPSAPPAAPPTAAAPDRSPSAAPASRPGKSGSLGSFMYVGTVIAEANGQPIYADKVLAKIDAELSQKANLPPTQFRQAAQNAISNQVQADIREELEYAAAQRAGSEEEQQAAAGLTTQWRQREINKAGGSLAVARRKSLDEDHIEFDEKVKDQYRRNLIILYYQQKIWPQVQVSADDLRRFYDRNQATLFSDASAVRFRAIQVSYRSVADRGRALTKAQGIHERAKRGEDFAILATEQNENANWAKNKGFILLVDEKDGDGQTRKVGAWFTKGTLKQEELEKAIFALEAGQVTEIIDGNNGFYLAKLEEKKVGRVRTFEEVKVQDAIREALEKQQRQQLRRKEQDKLLKSSVWRTDEKTMDIAVDMAMQKYAVWARAGK